MEIEYTKLDRFRPTASWSNLRLRAELLRRLREFFDQRGFLEVQTPVLSADTVVDRHLEPFFVNVSDSSGAGGQGSGVRGPEPQNEECKLQIADCKMQIGGSLPLIPNPQSLISSPQPADRPHPSLLPRGEGTMAIPQSLVPNPQSLIPNPSSCRMWLQTSPEFAMKRLLAAGSGPIYEVARVFRQGELGPLHNPEFTLVEWYRPGDTLDQGMQVTSELCESLFAGEHEKRGQAPFSGTALRVLRKKGACPLFSAERISYGQAFKKYIGIDPHSADTEQLVATVKSLGIEAPASMLPEDRDGWLDLLLVERVQPHLGIDRPTLLYDYPASQAALACVRDDDPPVAERFELYISGIELANGYRELLDPEELRRRNAKVNAQRRADGKRPLPEESRLLRAMEAGLPSAVGVALGFDRLVMLAAGAKTVAEVIAFPFDRA